MSISQNAFNFTNYYYNKVYSINYGYSLRIYLLTEYRKYIHAMLVDYVKIKSSGIPYQMVTNC